MKDNNIQAVLNKQRSDKFRMILTMPKVLRDIDTSDFSIATQELLNADSLQFSLYSTAIPEISIPPKQINHTGQSFNITSQVRTQYTPIANKFAVDNRFRNYWVLWKWLEVLNDPRTSGMDSRLAVPTTVPRKGQIDPPKTFWDYQTMITIIPLDEYNKSMCKFIFYNAFITNLSRMDFNYQTEDEIQGEFTFAFGQMDVEIEN